MKKFNFSFEKFEGSKISNLRAVSGGTLSTKWRDGTATPDERTQPDRNLDKKDTD